MAGLSFRPRPLDIHKKLPIVKSIKDFDDDETPTSTRNSQLLRIAPEVDNEAHLVPNNHSKKVAPEIPIPQFVVVDTYERDYSCTFSQPNSYLQARGGRVEIGEFVEYDLDNEDEDWLVELNKERKILTPEMFESLIFKLEVLDHKAHERDGVITPALGSQIPVLLRLDAAIEALQAQSTEDTVIQSGITGERSEKGGKSQFCGGCRYLTRLIAFCVQPLPPANDTNPYNVFRPREKAHRLQNGRMQKRENNVQSFEKLHQDDGVNISAFNDAGQYLPTQTDRQTAQVRGQKKKASVQQFCGPLPKGKIMFSRLQYRPLGLRPPPGLHHHQLAS